MTRRRGQAGGTTPVLEEGVTFVPIGISHEDSQFVDSRRLTTEEIARSFGVPPHMIGGDVQGSMSYSNSELESLRLLKHTLGPWLTRITSAVNDALIPRWSVGECTPSTCPTRCWPRIPRADMPLTRLGSRAASSPSTKCAERKTSRPCRSASHDRMSGLLTPLEPGRHPPAGSDVSRVQLLARRASTSPTCAGAAVARPHHPPGPPERAHCSACLE